jgi:hypothetical protein
MSPPRAALLLVLLLGMPAGAAAAEPAGPPIGLGAPMVLEYTGTARGTETRTVYRFRAAAPDWQVEWEEDFRLGAFVVPAEVLAGARRYYRPPILENGREVRLDGTLLVLSTALYDELERGGKAKLQLQRNPGWLEKTGEATVTVGERTVPALVARDNLDRTYHFQHDRSFPLLLQYRNGIFLERLSRVHHGSAPFRWYR